METEEHIQNALALIEVRMGWGKGEGWTTQDFEVLGEQIGAKTGVHLSTITLKRLWGRVKYSSAPSLTTLDALAQFIDHESWRDFKTKQAGETEAQKKASPLFQPETVLPTIKLQNLNRKNYLAFGLSIIIIGVFIYASYSLLNKAAEIITKDYRFSSKKVVAEGVPNSVIFDLDARQSPFDSVTIQQTWDKRRRGVHSKAPIPAYGNLLSPRQFYRKADGRRQSCKGA